MRWLAGAALACALAGCGATPRRVRGQASPIRHEGAELSPDEVFGYTVRARSGDTEYRGELLACDARSVYLLLHEPGPRAYVHLAWATVDPLRVRLPGDGPALLGWTIGGAVSTLTHGYWLVVSLPAWLTVGVSGTIVAWAPEVSVEGCAEARAWARFPAGLPLAFRSRFGIAETSPAELVAPWEVPQGDGGVVSPSP